MSKKRCFKKKKAESTDSDSDHDSFLDLPFIYNSSPTNDFEFPFVEELITEIGPAHRYYFLNLSIEKTIQLLNYHNGQIIEVNLKTKVYQISQINNGKLKSDFIPINFKNKREAKLYRAAKYLYKDANEKCICSIY